MDDEAIGKRRERKVDEREEPENSREHGVVDDAGVTVKDFVYHVAYEAHDDDYENPLSDQIVSNSGNSNLSNTTRRKTFVQPSSVGWMRCSVDIPERREAQS